MEKLQSDLSVPGSHCIILAAADHAKIHACLINAALQARPKTGEHLIPGSITKPSWDEQGPLHIANTA